MRSNDQCKSMTDEDPYKQHVNPFTYKPKMTTMDWFKVIFNTMWLLPLRIVFIIIPSFTMGMIICTISVIGDTFDETNPRPLRGWRRFLINTIGGWLARLILFGFGFHCIKVRGQPSSEAPIMVVSPHSSVLDMFFIATVHVPTYVAKEEARTVPILGYLVTHALRTIFVKREDPSSRQQCTAEIVRRAKDSASGWPKIMIFPEATTHSREVHLKFKKGAFLPGLPIQGVVIKHNNNINTTVWTDKGQSMITSFYLTICQFHNNAEIEFLPTYYPTQEEINNPELFAENVRISISHITGISISNYSIDDMLVCRKAEILGMPFETGLISYPTAHRELRLDMNDVKRWLQRFSYMDIDKDGYITSDDICHYLSIPSDACTQAVFTALCKGSNDRGKLNFRQYLYGVVSMSLPFTTNEALNEMFQFFDTNNDGLITLQDICSQLPVQWTNQSELSNYRGIPPHRRSGCDMCGCQRKRLLDHTHQKASLPSTMTYDQFCLSMMENLEYLLLYHECQTAALSSPSTCYHDNSLHDDTTPAQLVVSIES